jgi:hypothetical protein
VLHLCLFDIVSFQALGACGDEVRRVLSEAEYLQAMNEFNYEVASQLSGCEVVEDELRLMIRRPQNV